MLYFKALNRLRWRDLFEKASVHLKQKVAQWVLFGGIDMKKAVSLMMAAAMTMVVLSVFWLL